MNIDDALIRKSERAHYLMQLSSYFTELTDRPGVRYAYTERFGDIWYNQAYDVCWEGSIETLIEDVNAFCRQHDRTPCIYTSAANMPADIDSRLSSAGLVTFEEEAWMFYNFSPDNGEYELHQKLEIMEIVESNFDVFAQVYRAGLPGPEVEDYIAATKNGLFFAPPLVDVSYFVAMYDNEPAGMISLLQLGEYAGIYAVATIESFRRIGIARAMNQHAVGIASQSGAKHIFLQTVAGEESEEVFRRIGYETLFVRKGFTTKEAVENMQHG